MTTITKADFFRQITDGETIFINAKFRGEDVSEEKLTEMLTERLSDIMSGKLGVKRHAVANRSTLVTFSDGSNCYKNDKGWTFSKFVLDKFTCYVKKFAMEDEGWTSHYNYCIYMK